MTQKCCYDRVIDKEASAEKLKKIRQEKGLSVKKFNIYWAARAIVLSTSGKMHIHFLRPKT